MVIIGGGAAGFFSAITFKQTNPNEDVIILEAGHGVLQKVKISGGGRCNVTHACFDPKTLTTYYPRGQKALYSVFSRFNPTDTINWFERRGVSLKTESDGRIFPKSNTSETIINCLLTQAKNLGIQIQPLSKVQSIQKIDHHFTLTLKDRPPIQTNSVALCTGSSPIGHQLAKALGHTIIPPVPSLFTFTVADKRLRLLSGISVSTVEVMIPGSKLPSQTGGVLVTHWGLSGPAIIKQSAWGARFLAEKNYKFTVQLNWLPTYSKNELSQQIIAMSQRHPKKNIIGTSPFSELPNRLWEWLLDNTYFKTRDWKSLQPHEIEKLITILTQKSIEVTGKSAFKDEFVTAGGIDLKEINFKTMESKRCPGLYFAGEILDIDGVTGGFNFQNAWSTGYILGQNKK